jgi:hypothetical protein
MSTVYSFVPIPGAQQHKRPRRRYEEIERMYKCGWNGCEKAYGTLNHLNAHVTMQSHGAKRTPEGMQRLEKRMFKWAAHFASQCRIIFLVLTPSAGLVKPPSFLAEASTPAMLKSP